MAEILLFGGTTEGRELAELLSAKGTPTLVLVATEYGEALLDAGGSVAVRGGRLDEAAIAALIRKEAPRCVIDATHPYAAEAGANIRAACQKTGVKRLRVLRESTPGAGCVEFSDMDALIGWLNGRDDTVFSSLGTKEAAALARVCGYKERVWLRILPSPEGLCACIEAGFPPARIICMQGPFSKELNAAMFRATGASTLITKDSGIAGGFPEKLAAARECGMTVAVLARPRRENGLTLGELKQRIEENAL
ncbi:MAG: precorrin-6A reductase [Bacillota bacterium]